MGTLSCPTSRYPHALPGSSSLSKFAHLDRQLGAQKNAPARGFGGGWGCWGFLIFETQTHPVTESIIIGRQIRFLHLSKRKKPPLRRSRLPAALFNGLGRSRQVSFYKRVKRHDECPSAPGRAAAKQSLTPTPSHSSTLPAPRCRQGPLEPVSHFHFWHGRTNERPPRNTAETDRPLS